ncbi:MAG: hypothetical protein ABH843_02985 [Candidatus Omnitrophota bacterium]
MDKGAFYKISRLSIFLIMVSLILSYPVPSQTAWGKGEAEAKAAKEAKEAEEAKKAKMAAIEKKRQMIKVVKEKLNNTAWNIEIKKLGSAGKDKKPEIINDRLNFVNNQVGSAMLGRDGFSNTNFSVRINESRGPTGKDLIIWETMQTSEEKGLSFWRGEFEEGDTTMRGALSRHYDKENIENYTFSGVKGDIAEAPAPEAEEAVVVEPAKEDVGARLPLEASGGQAASGGELEEKVVEKAEEIIKKTEEKAEEKIKKAEPEEKKESAAPAKKEKKKRGLW